MQAFGITGGSVWVFKVAVHKILALSAGSKNIQQANIIISHIHICITYSVQYTNMYIYVPKRYVSPNNKHSIQENLRWL